MVPNASPHIRFVFDWSEVDWQYLLATRCQDAGITKVHGLGKCGAVARMDLVIFFLIYMLYWVLVVARNGLLCLGRLTSMFLHKPNPALFCS